MSRMMTAVSVIGSAPLLARLIPLPDMEGGPVRDGLWPRNAFLHEDGDRRPVQRHQRNVAHLLLCQRAMELGLLGRLDGNREPIEDIVHLRVRIATPVHPGPAPLGASSLGRMQ